MKKKPINNSDTTFCQKKYRIEGDLRPQNIKQISSKDIELADKYLSKPIILSLLNNAHTAEEITEIFKLNIRKPFLENDFMIQLFKVIISSDNTVVAESILKSIPNEYLNKHLSNQTLVSQIISEYTPSNNMPCKSDNIDNNRKTIRPVFSRISRSTLNKAIDNEKTMKLWFDLINQLPHQLFIEYFNQIDSQNFNKHSDSIFSSFNIAPERKIHTSCKDGFALSENLLSMLTNPIINETIKSTKYPLLKNTDPNTWHLLFEKGFHIYDVEENLNNWFSTFSLFDLQKIWPTVFKNVPALKQKAIPLVMKNFILHSEGLPIKDEDLKKIKYLISQQIERPFVEISQMSIIGSQPEVLKQLLDLKITKPFPIPQTPDFTQAIPNCQFRHNNIWDKALLDDIITEENIFESRVYIDTMQLIEINNDTSCAIMVSGSNSVNRVEYTPQTTDHDSFYGPISADPYPSCPDSLIHSQIWVQKNNKIEKYSTSPIAEGILHLKDKNNNYLYHINLNNDNCRGRFSRAELYTIRYENKLFIETPKPIMNALEKQCDLSNMLENCKSITKIKDDKSLQTKNSLYQPKDRQSFIDQYNGVSQKIKNNNDKELAKNKEKDKLDYIKSVIELNKEQLRLIELKNTPPHDWTGDALEAISKAEMSVEKKRQRISWIFKNHEQLKLYSKNSSQNAIYSLVNWLPTEDWWPILKFMDLSSLSKEARENNNPDLACAMDHSGGLMCDETWSAEEEMETN